MKKTTFLLVDQEALPPVFAKVIEAKEYLRNSQASSTTEAARMAGISRSVFYKYKDAVYPYQEKNTDSIITVQVVLLDKPGVLMALISQFYRVGANILTINQNIQSMEKLWFRFPRGLIIWRVRWMICYYACVRLMSCSLSETLPENKKVVILGKRFEYNGEVFLIW